LAVVKQGEIIFGQAGRGRTFASGDHVHFDKFDSGAECRRGRIILGDGLSLNDGLSGGYRRHKNQKDGGARHFILSAELFAYCTFLFAHNGLTTGATARVTLSWIRLTMRLRWWPGLCAFLFAHNGLTTGATARVILSWIRLTMRLRWWPGVCADRGSGDSGVD
jgi:hypothetical protein